MVHGFSVLLFLLGVITYGICIASLGIIKPIIGDGLLWGTICLSSMIFLTYISISSISNYLTSCIITNQRIIFLENISLFATGERIIQLSDITKIQSESRGFFQTLFSYGTISLGYHSGSDRELEFPYISHPSEIVEFIHALKEKETNMHEKVAK